MARSGSDKRQRTERETVRLTPEERAELRLRAATSGLKTPAYIRHQCLEKPPARAQRGATPNDQFIARMLHHLTAAAEFSRAGAREDVEREHVMIRHLLCKAAGGQP